MNDLEAYAKLSPFKPSELAGFRVGDLVTAGSLGRCRITALHPPALVELQTSGGGKCRVGWRAVRRVEDG